VSFTNLPFTACWQHRGLRSGFEVVYFTPQPSGLRVEGTTTLIQGGDPAVVTYQLEVDEAWRTRRAWIRSRTSTGWVEQLLESDGEGHWQIEGQSADQLDGCFDVDLEASALTNALPVHRLDLAVGGTAAAPAAYVRLADPQIRRLDQAYARVQDQHGRQTYDYEAPAFEFRCQLIYDRAGLVLEYPEIAVRAG
jgi:uncharacterized protein